MNINVVHIAGYLTKAPELTYTTSRLPVAKFTIATNQFRMQNGERVQEAEYHTCVAFDKQAESIAEHLGKGALIYVQGYLKTRKWKGSCNQNHSITEVIVQRTSWGPKSAQVREPGADDDKVISQEQQIDDDVPF